MNEDNFENWDLGYSNGYQEGLFKAVIYTAITGITSVFFHEAAIVIAAILSVAALIQSKIERKNNESLQRLQTEVE